MVQLKYFGDSRDFFKYDLITTLLQSGKFNNYVFIPMLTEHRDDNEGNITPRSRGGNSQDLLKFIEGCNNKSLRHWETWLKAEAKKVDYAAIKPVDGLFFTDEGREKYWRRHESLLNREKTLVFVDPDTGLETGNPSYLRRMGLEKYILNDELRLLIKDLSKTSVLMIYQHLPRNSDKHMESVKNKIKQILDIDQTVLVCAYREHDLAFLFICKDADLYKSIYELLKKFYEGGILKALVTHPIG